MQRPAVMEQKKNTLSVVMIVKNEEGQLRGCLERIACIADEIIIVDSGSTDATCAIAEDFGAKLYVNTDWKGFGQQRRLAQSFASGDYVLALDADERVSNRLRDSIVRILEQPLSRARPFALMRRDFFAGRPVYPLGRRERIARLYSRRHFTYDDAPVHELLQCELRRCITLKGNLDHNLCDDIGDYRSRAERYAKDWGMAASNQRKRCSKALVELKTWAAFLRVYLFRGGFLSGRRGYQIARVTSQYTQQKYQWLRSRQYNQQPGK